MSFVYAELTFIFFPLENIIEAVSEEALRKVQTTLSVVFFFSW